MTTPLHRQVPEGETPIPEEVIVLASGEKYYTGDIEAFKQRLADNRNAWRVTHTRSSRTTVEGWMVEIAYGLPDFDEFTQDQVAEWGSSAYSEEQAWRYAAAAWLS